MLRGRWVALHNSVEFPIWRFAIQIDATAASDTHGILPVMISIKNNLMILYGRASARVVV
jgi:hypothetical protein